MEKKMKMNIKKVKGIVLELGHTYSKKTFLYTGDQAKLMSVLNELVAIDSDYINEDFVEDAPCSYVYYETDTSIEIKLGKAFNMIDADTLKRYTETRRKYYEEKEAAEKAAKEAEGKEE